MNGWLFAISLITAFMAGSSACYAWITYCMSVADWRPHAIRAALAAMLAAWPWFA